MPDRVRTDIIAPGAEPLELVAAWKRAVQDTLAGTFRKPTFLDWYQDAVDRLGIPADADVCTSFAGPMGVVNVLGTCFARREEAGTRFVYWTEGPMLIGGGKRDLVHDAISAMLARRFPSSRPA